MHLSIPISEINDELNKNESNHNELHKNNYDQLLSVSMSVSDQDETLKYNTVPRNILCEMCGRKKISETHDTEHMIQIVDHLYLGGKRNVCNMVELISFKIELIINVANEVENKFYEFFDYVKFPWNDFPEFNILEHLDSIVDRVYQAISDGQNVLVHCRMGLSRSVSVVIAYLMKYENKSYDDAYDFVKSKNKLICPNDGFVLQLKDYNKKLKISRT
jgi:predicted protein tyrosine phosphatase